MARTDYVYYYFGSYSILLIAARIHHDSILDGNIVFLGKSCPACSVQKQDWKRLEWTSQGDGGVTIPVQEMTGLCTLVPGSIWQGSDQSKVRIDDLRGLFQLKRFCEYRGYPFSEVLLFSSSSKLLFIGRSQMIYSGQATDRETVPVLPMSCGASETT